MWDQYKTYGADFEAGEDEMDLDVEQGRLRKQADVFGLMNAEAVARKLGFGTDDVGEDILGDEEEEDFLSEIMGKAALQEPDQADIQPDGQPNTQSSSQWFPYPTKTVRHPAREFLALFHFLNFCLDLSFGYFRQFTEIAGL
ncbi:hypothetical protein C8R44DRAFT_749956 [Mycena epipterygia]|nr:hypothetical protein C8R44DRAFT_749956 [Mycena epipterygia]